jgi:uncharacterized repeat protein (TIGR03803 family)
MRLSLAIAAFCLCTIVLGCSQQTTALPFQPVGSAAGLRSRVGYASLYSFKGSPDGESPLGGITVDENGNLYGATEAGGKGIHACTLLGAGCGSVYELSASGAERLVHAFGRPPDGAIPPGGLVKRNGRIFGTTINGGIYTCLGIHWYCGTVYEVSASGVESILHRFVGPPDGAQPLGGLYEANGNLYGTTYYGGAVNKNCGNFGCGTLYEVNASGIEHVLYRFKGADGAYPAADVIEANGNLYGTTTSGGTGCSEGGCGAVYEISESGKERVLHNFGGGLDGYEPNGQLAEFMGTLYGETLYGGDSHCKTYRHDHVQGAGCGTVYAVSTSGSNYRVLYRFKGIPDGVYPSAGVIAANGHLFGVTSRGGTGRCKLKLTTGATIPIGCGTVYEVSLSGAERVLYSFKGSPDGAYPAGPLSDVNGTLFGTTYKGGTVTGNPCYIPANPGCGTVFELTP